MNNVTTMINNMTIRERKDGRYEGRLTIDGKRKGFYGSTKTEVKKKAKEYLMKVGNGYKEPEKILLNDYIEYWLKTYKFNKIEPSSYTRLYNVYKCQIKPSLGTKTIGTITTKDIQNLIDERANPIDENTKALAISGLKKIIHLLRPCMNIAVKEGIISFNPCKDVILPIESCVKIKTKEQFSLSDEELKKIKNEALSRYKTSGNYKSRDALVLLLIVNLGLRVGEMLVLEWKDINVEKKVVYIRKTLQSGVKKFHENDNHTYSIVKDSTKTPKGMRVIPLNNSTIEVIERIKEFDETNNIVSNYVACTTVGTLNTPRNLQRSLDRLTKNANIKEHVSLHTLRHTFGSTLLRHGANVEVVSKLMGHANISITYNKYIHVIQEQQAMTMNMISVC